MFRRVEPIFVSRQETVVLPKVEPIVAEGVHVVVKVRYSEPRLHQQNGSIIKGVSRDWTKGIHSVNKVPRPNFLACCTYAIKLDTILMNVHLLKIM
jgi:hypothetical protein